MKQLKKSKVRKYDNIWVGDFETTTMNSQYFKTHNKGRLIAFEVQLLGDESYYFQGVSMFEFENWFKTLKGKHQIYFHNLGKFDGFVLLNYALDKWYNELQPKDSDIEYTYSLINSKILSFTITNRKTKAVLVFNDSLMLLMYSIQALGKMYNQPKGTTDYDIEPVNKIEDLPKGYLDYLHQDVRILNIALLDFSETVTKIFNKYKIDGKWNQMTLSSLSRNLINGVDKNGYYKITFYQQIIAKDYYYGGFTQLNKTIEDKIIDGDFLMIDAKSHYPSVMTLYELPAYEPVKIKPKDIPDYKCVFVSVKGVIKKCKTDWGTIRLPNDFNHYIVYKEDFEFEFKGTYLEWSIQTEFYEFSHWEYTEIWGFEETQNIMNNVLTDFYNLKETEKNNLTYKILINSMYGSCGMRANYPEIFFFKKDEEKPNEFVNETKTKGYVYLCKKNKNFFNDYEAHEYGTRYKKEHKCWNRWIAAYITSIGRYILMRNIALKPDSVYYCDTDSMIVDKDYPVDKISLGKKMGDWDIDKKDIKRIIVQGPKRYMLANEDNKVVKTSFAGLRKDIFDEFFDDNISVFNNEVVEQGQQKVIISKDYNWFPMIDRVDYINKRKITLNKMK